MTPRRELRLMNAHMVDVPLWDAEGLVDHEELPLSDELVAALRAFAARWEASVPDDGFDDRWDGVPVVDAVVGLSRDARRLVRRSERRAAKAEDAAIRAEGERLRDLVQAELGEGFAVVYHHD